MRIDRPPPGEGLNEGEPTTPRLAASIVLLRESAAGGEPEVLLVKRNPAASFMGGVWVFPGGSVGEHDGGPEGAALRELLEEAGIELHGGTAELVPFARWITPAEVRVRFDTWFYLAAAPEGAEPQVDGEECVDAIWLAPAHALERGGDGQLQLVFPTIKQLERLSGAETVDEALARARAAEVTPILPRVIREGDAARVVLPGEPGYGS
jgi:8-oxo-dGTP pyrophosphatase MutT (NUDIX family)